MKSGAAAGTPVFPTEHWQPPQPAGASPQVLMRPKKCFWQELIVVCTRTDPLSGILA